MGYRAAGVVPDGRAGTVTPDPSVIREARRRPATVAKPADLRPSHSVRA
ncbi:hypothetical protein AB0G05_30035 [Nonomuraea wenchangensis]